MIFYLKNNFAFQHINRTGGTSIKKMIRGIAGEPDKGSIYEKIEHRALEIRFNTLDKKYPEVDLKTIPIYVNIRNPFDRIVSIFAYRRGRGKYKKVYFKNFFYNIYMQGERDVNCSQELFCCIDGVKPKNVIPIRFENINTQWPKIIQKHFNFKIDIFPKMNSSKHIEPMKYFNQAMIEKVLKKELWVVKNFYPELMELSK